jgi:hypothetical protein
MFHKNITIACFRLALSATCHTGMINAEQKQAALLLTLSPGSA